MVNTCWQILNLIQGLSELVLILIMAECFEVSMIDWGRDSDGYRLLNRMIQDFLK